MAFRSTDDIFFNASIRDASNPFLGGSMTTTSDPTSQKKGSCYLQIFHTISSKHDKDISISRKKKKKKNTMLSFVDIYRLFF